MYIVKSQKGNIGIYQNNDGKIIFEYDGGKYVFNSIGEIYRELLNTGKEVILKDLYMPSYEFFTVMHHFIDNKNRDITSFFG